MITLTSQAGAVYRTKLMDHQRAETFARMLAGNARFAWAAVRESSRTKNPTVRYYVEFAPSSPERCRALVDGQQADRAARGEQEAADYLVAQDESGRFYWVMKLSSGAVYHTYLGRACDCGDATWRTNGLGLTCKHDQVVRAKHRRGEIVAFAVLNNA